MDIFHVLTMIGGLSLFLFGMNVMGQALERRAGNRLKTTLERMTSSRLMGFLTGCGVTAVIQSSSATTVMVVGFVNSGLMTLKQAIHVIMGANVGTTVTSWILSLSGLDSSDSVQFGFCGHFAGSCRYRTGVLRGFDSYYYGAEYRDLCDSTSLFDRSEQECKKSCIRSSEL